MIDRIIIAFSCSMCAVFCVLPAFAEAMDTVVFIKVVEKTNGQTRNSGSGVLLSESGFILTAQHILEDFAPARDNILVSLKSKNRPGYRAKRYNCQGGDVDMCLIKISEDDVKADGMSEYYAPDCRALSNSERLFVVGWPFGEDNTRFQAEGKVTGQLGNIFMYPTNLPVLPGMSGSPVLDEKSRLVGIVKGAISGNTHYSYVTPLSLAQNILQAANISCNRAAPSEQSKPSEKKSSSSVNVGGSVNMSGSGNNIISGRDVTVTTGTKR